MGRMLEPIPGTRHASFGGLVACWKAPRHCPLLPEHLWSLVRTGAWTKTPLLCSPAAFRVSWLWFCWHQWLWPMMFSPHSINPSHCHLYPLKPPSLHCYFLDLTLCGILWPSGPLCWEISSDSTEGDELQSIPDISGPSGSGDLAVHHSTEVLINSRPLTSHNLSRGQRSVCTERP